MAACTCKVAAYAVKIVLRLSRTEHVEDVAGRMEHDGRDRLPDPTPQDDVCGMQGEEIEQRRARGDQATEDVGGHKGRAVKGDQDGDAPAGSTQLEHRRSTTRGHGALRIEAGGVNNSRVAW